MIQMNQLLRTISEYLNYYTPFFNMDGTGQWYECSDKIVYIFILSFHKTRVQASSQEDSQMAKKARS